MNTTTRTKRNLWWLIALSTLLATLNGQAEKFDSDKKKEINQSFPISTDGKLVVDNRYGNVTVTHWSKNEVSIRVVIESKARSESEAQRGLDRVNVQIQKSGNTVYAKTSLIDQSGNSGNHRININYYISIPFKLAVNISQKYGSINLPEKNEGKCELEVKYGNIIAGSFTLPLKIDAGYSNINLNEVQDLRMDLSYCGNVDVNNGGNLNIDSKYSNLKMGNVGKLKLEQKYSNLTMQKADKVSMDIKYSEIKIGHVKEEIDIDELSYSTLTINELSSNFKRIKVEAKYGTLNLSIPSNASFNVNAQNMKHGNLDVKGFNITNSNIENKVNYYYQINGGNSNNVIDFEGNNYSSLKIRTL
ncbi:MAG: hypothetical protein LBH58_04405 [Tannerellaceae bacterium]|jgi:hypothetical protein|nr:hypothetical protein [Tannerellaceae bacterium]